VKGGSSISSAAKATCDHMHDWWNGTKPGASVAMAVSSEGNKFGVPEDLFFSYPVEVKDGEWRICECPIDEKTKTFLMESAEELRGEKEMAMSLF